jgi:radical SAM superfamily enzyme YgiQ (UPF0313 family)
MRKNANPRVLLIKPSRLLPNGMPVRIRREGMRTLTLPYLAGMTPAPWEPRVKIDALDPVTGREEADLVAISMLTQQAPRAYQIADHFRRRNVPVVLGGVHATLNVDEAAAHADAVAIGEGEAIWTDILNDAFYGRLRTHYQAGSHHSLRELAAPRFDLFPQSRYYTLLRPVQTTRGCPHGCDFCTVSRVYGRSYRHRPVEEVVEDVKRIRSASRYVFFVDDNLAADGVYARALFEALIPLKISWSAQLTIGFAEDEDLLRLATRSGFQMAVCGVENVSRANLESVAKGGVNDPRRYGELLVRYRRHGIIVLAGMILGFDTDTEETVARNLRFMLEEKIPMISLFLLTPFPGTPLFERLDGEGRILTRAWSRYDSYPGVYRPGGMGADRLTQLYWNACRRITTLPSIVRRFSPPPRPRMRTLLPDLLATGLVFANNLLLFRPSARRCVPPAV